MRDDYPKEEFAALCEKCQAEMYQKAKEFGGQVSGEHGIGRVRVDALADFMGPEMIALFRGIKKAFDPNGILNPGKVIR